MSEFREFLNEQLWDEEFREQWEKIQPEMDLIDEVYIYHLARHFIEPEELLPLKELPLTKNPFSDFLSNHRIYFLEQNGRIEFYYQGRLILPDEILSSG